MSLTRASLPNSYKAKLDALRKESNALSLEHTRARNQLLAKERLLETSISIGEEMGNVAEYLTSQALIPPMLRPLPPPSSNVGRIKERQAVQAANLLTAMGVLASEHQYLRDRVRVLEEMNVTSLEESDIRLYHESEPVGIETVRNAVSMDPTDPCFKDEITAIPERIQQLLEKYEAQLGTLEDSSDQESVQQGPSQLKTFGPTHEGHGASSESQQGLSMTVITRPSPPASTRPRQSRLLIE